jgi:hypothetical protein
MGSLESNSAIKISVDVNLKHSDFWPRAAFTPTENDLVLLILLMYVTIPMAYTPKPIFILMLHYCKLMPLSVDPSLIFVTKFGAYQSGNSYKSA